MLAGYTMTMERARRLRDEGKSRYLIGVPDFPEIIQGDYLYIDKTKDVYKMTHCAARHIFLSRPRRFGKSLLVSTLQSYFEGRRDLFRGLAIERMEKEWTEYPVLHFDMSKVKGCKAEDLTEALSRMLEKYESIYGRNESDRKAYQRLESLIENAYLKTGKKVVVLIDEYDYPLLKVVHDENNFPEIRDVMKDFYGPLKSQSKYLRFVFLTGITKFSQVSIFSELNNITDISMEEEFAECCGITQGELLYQMPQEVDKLAKKLGVTSWEAARELKRMYDGYHFAWPSADIYNPYSLMNALYWKKLEPFWFGTGTPSFLVEMLKKFEVAPSEIGGNKLKANSFHVAADQLIDIIPLLYQSGYLTITDYNPDSDLYTLDIPNNEVSSGLFDELLPYYVNIRKEDCDAFNGEMKKALERDDVDGMMTLFKEFFSSIPHVSNTNYEGHYQQIMYIVYRRLTKDVHLEEHTAEGRIDLVVEFRGRAYIFELKLDGSAAEALRQIDARNYAACYAFDGLPVTKVGVGFDSKARTISGWAFEE